MSTSTPEVVEALRVALKERDRLRKENARLFAGTSEPIAIVGMACRYPGGVASPRQLWDLVAEGRDAIGLLPADRGWDLERLYDPDPDKPGTSYAREGGFVASATHFDSGFFGLPPREVAAGDPQARLLLEASWEAFEDAGIVPSSLHGSQTGVFAGAMYQDYAWGRDSTSADQAGLEPIVAAGSILTGRIAYTYGLEGPTVTIDTACSSSLVATHLAAQALRGGECSLALAGGVTVLSTPRSLIEASRQRGLAPDGRSKSFAEAADGVGFSEGVGLLVLERLSDAERNGHRVLALLRGSAVNQDGASNGLTAPNGPSQERVIRQALANAGLEPKDVDAVEAHGTGTTLGDPIEAGALLATYGQERERPLKLGSIKSNIGHPQAAAGVAGVIKTVMAMGEGVLPKSLHIDAPSSKIDWEAGEIELLTEAVEWKPNGRPRRAGVSSFGASGTNAHLVLEESPDSGASATAVEGGPGEGPSGALLPEQLPLLVSAKSEEALRESAGQLADRLREDPDLDPADVAYSLATTRTHMERRAVAVGGDREQLLAGLSALARGASSSRTVSDLARGSWRPAFLFPGYGSQWVGMGLELIEASPVFARSMGECTEALEPHLDCALYDVLRGTDGAPALDDVTVGPSALFATMVSLAKLWRACGVEPAAVAGHSQGELIAAHVAGGLGLDDAARAVALRSRVLLRLIGHGAMASVALSAEQVEPRLADCGEGVEVAALNGPSSTVVSGDPEGVDELVRRCESEGVHARRIRGANGASHSPHVEALREELLEVLAPIAPRSGEIPFYSTVTGDVLDTAELDAEYWYRNARQTVQLEPVVRRLIANDVRALIEVSPHPVLTVGLQETAEAAGGDRRAGVVLDSLRRDDGGAERFALSLSQAHAAGVEVDWPAFFSGSAAKQVQLPTYPFQRKRYWLDSGSGGSDPSAIGLGDTEHLLLRAAIEDPEEDRLTLSGRVSLQSHRWLADHTVSGAVLLPGSAFLELALEAGKEAGCERVEELALEAPLVVPTTSGAQLRVTVGEPDQDGARPLSIHSRPEGDEASEWTRNAKGRVSAAPPGASAAALDAWPPPGAEPIDVDDAYDRLADLGLDYGPAFQGLSAAWKRDGEVFAEVSLAREQAQEAGRFGVHPALLDAALHAGFAASLDRDGGAPTALQPLAWTGVSLQAGGATALRVRIGRADEGRIELTLADQEGAPVACVDELRLGVGPSAGLAAGTRGVGGLFHIEWIEAPPAQQGTSPASDSPPDLIRLEDLDFERSSDAADSARAAAAAALAELKRWLADSPPGSRLALLASGAVSVGPGEEPDLASAAVWGLLRAAQAEQPGRITLIDSDGIEGSTAALPAALVGCEEEPQLALREGKRLLPRVAPLDPPPDDESAAPQIDPDRTVLVSGGSGRVGALVARHLVAEHGARHLLLVGRSGAGDEGTDATAAELGELGASVRIEACDVSDRAALERLLGSIDPEHPLGAVFHAAALADDGLIDSIGPEQLERTFAPKVAGAWHLHELTAGLDLDAFVTFAAATGTLGGVGRANAAAADAFLEGLSRHRRARGLPGLTVAWGLWDRESGVSSHLSDAERARMESAGLLAVSAADGLALLDAALAGGPALTLAAPLDRAALRAATLPPLFGKLVRSRGRRRAATGGSLAGKLAKLPEADRASFVLDLVRGEAAVVLGHDSVADVDPDRSFRELGFESAAAVELRNRLVDATGMRLAATLVFDYPSPAGVAEHLLEQASGAAESRPVVLRAQSSEEPIAIVGMSCRYPGAVSSPEQLWQLLARGGDAIAEFPSDRGWDLERLFDPDPEKPGTSYAREGGFLYDAGEFDPGFFGISPREALAMDPQQRLLLEASWEALEGAGVDPSTLRGSATGIFAGVSSLDYVAGLTAPDEELEGYRLTGVAGSVVSGRVAYALGLEGPTMTVDTACSSSLVAIHLASQALRQGECSLALAGGVAVLSTPLVFSEFSRQRGLAPDGRCKPFAEAADGTGWAEGVGVLALERLSEAEANGHGVLATIRGSAVNQDGASNGLTAPNGPSQERVIRQALANARLEPKDVDAVEAHGTGTMLGDPIEANALLATYGREREAPLKLGSIKSNIGHAQAAAGVAGVIKTVMAMREGLLPKTLHVDAPSSKVDWEMGEIELLSEAVQWAPNGHPRRAGISSFGMSGTNAHMILEEAPRGSIGTGKGGEVAGAPAAQGSLSGPVPLVLSAKSPEALRESAERLAAHLKADPELDPTDLAFSLATTRAAMEQRAAVVGEDREELLEALNALASDSPSPNTHTATAQAGRLAYLFTGQGSQRAGMGKALYETYPTYKEALDEICAEIDPHLDRPLKDLLFAEPGSSEAEALDNTTYAQPALFATEVALFRTLHSFGLKPDLLTGHSVGEIVAAHISGVLDLKDAAKLICARGRLMGELSEGGAMVAIEATEAEAIESIQGKEELLSLAAINGPNATVISGEAKAIEEIESHWQERGRKTKRLSVSHAFHSPLIEPMREEFAKAIADLSFNAPKIPIVSNTSGELLTDEQATDPAYWVSHVREPVRFADAVGTLKEQGTTTYLEIGPEAVLTAMAASTLGDEDKAELIATLREGRDEAKSVALAFATAFAAGAKPEWSAFFEGTNAKAVPLPTYPFQRKRYWLKAASGTADPSAIGQLAAEHPFLATTIEDAGGDGLTFTGRIALRTHPWLADYVAGDMVLLPGTAFVEMALRAGQEVGFELLEELALQAPLLIPESGGVALQVRVEAPGERGEREVSIHSRPEADEDGEQATWTCHAQGTLTAEAPEPPEPLEAWPPAGAEPLELDSIYDRLADVGFDYGPAFQGLTAAWKVGEEVCAEVSLAEEQAAEAGRFGIHPALFDSTIHGGFLLAMSAEAMESASGPILPFAWTGVQVDLEGATSLRVRLRMGEDSFTFSAFDPTGASVLSVDSLIGRPVSAQQLAAPKPAQEGLLGLEWTEVPEVTGEPAAKVIALADLLEETATDPAQGAHAAAQAALALAKEWIADTEQPEGARLALLTEAAVVVGEGESPDPAAATVWGLLRSAQSEHPGRFALIDTDGSDASRQALAKAIATSATEPQLALRDGELLGARITPTPKRPGAMLTPPPGPWCLEASERGSLDGLRLLSTPHVSAPLQEGTVRIAIGAAGLNFRDVMSVLGLYPGEAGIGSEGAGTVVELGPGVEGLAVGERVMGMIPGAFGPLAIADRRTLVAVPEGWSLARAAAVPIVWTTAHYALNQLAELKPGERVLIHADGVGSAALALARHLGAEVFATAGPAKWEALEAAGVSPERIASSLDTEFAERFLALTEGEGLDVVLSSLAGELVDASLRLLPRGGRFLEMGKTDIRDPEALARSHPGLAYRAFDLSEAGHERIGELLAEVVAMLDGDGLELEEPRSWDLRRAPEAFRHLREGNDVGKVVLEVPRPIDPERTVLLSGATGGLGTLLARHLVEAHGARHLLLLSRSGPDAPSAPALSAELAELGAEVRIEACDVADRDKLAALIDSIDPAHPLGAVIHAAGAIEDGLIESMTPEALDRVLAAKADGAWNLHELSKDLELSTFAMFSSMAGTMGGPGQGNYAAANVFLDALAARRQAEGLAATSIAWGLWERESGMTADLDEADRMRMRRVGAEALSDEQGLELFDAALGSGGALEFAARIDRTALGKLASAGILPPILSGLVRRRAERRSAPTVSLAKRLAKLPAQEHQAAVLELVREETAAVLGHSSGAEVAPERPFNELGFDSLAAVELRNRLTALTAMRLPATLVFDYPNATAIAGYLLAEIDPSAETIAANELDRLERALAEIPSDDPQRSSFAVHLRALAADLESDTTAEDDDGEIERLEAASDEELLEFIDEQVGPV